MEIYSRCCGVLNRVSLVYECKHYYQCSDIKDNEKKTNKVKKKIKKVKKDKEVTKKKISKTNKKIQQVKTKKPVIKNKTGEEAVSSIKKRIRK